MQKVNSIEHIFHIFALLVVCTACNNKTVHQFSGNGLGTYYQITYEGKENANLQKQVDSLLRHYSHEFSIFDTTSALFQINTNRKVVLGLDFVELLEKSLNISEMTNGAFDVTVAPLVTHWGFGPEAFFRTDTHLIDSLRTFVGFRKIAINNNLLSKTDERIQLNFNAVAKGYIVDKVAEFIINQYFNNFIVDIGGEVICHGKKNNVPWKVGIQTPTKDRNGDFASLYTFPLTDRAVATSGNYRNYIENNGERYTHIIDPATGFPQKSNLLSVTVIAEDCLTADALATAFMVMGVEKSLHFLTQNPQYAALFILAEKDGGYKVVHSEGFNDSMIL
ncbi:MAG: FAD:protein FMN transferase [Bacteroidales bacterium]|jgi:thiamine biosynthesis lipoprotein|nr:FAD:protein FMN transferase [Bacteroidales bacterium]